MVRTCGENGEDYAVRGARDLVVEGKRGRWRPKKDVGGDGRAGHDGCGTEKRRRAGSCEVEIETRLASGGPL